MKSEKCIIVGPSGAGKDFLLRGLKKLGLKYQPKVTTRPIRLNETNGIEYNFISNNQFQELLESNKVMTHQHFLINGSDWYYSITRENFDENQLFIMTPLEISNLNSEDRKKCFIVYLDIHEDVRRSRILKRKDQSDSVERRIAADNKDFLHFSDYDLKISDPDFEIEAVYDLMF